MSDIFHQLSSLNKLLDFDALTKHASLYSFQGRLNYLIHDCINEITLLCANLTNPSYLKESIVQRLNASHTISGGNLSQIAMEICQLFEYDTLDINTELEVEKLRIRQLLTWARDSTWSYNGMWEEYRVNLSGRTLLYSLQGKELRRHTFGIVYQSGLKKFENRLNELVSNQHPVRIQVDSKDLKEQRPSEDLREERDVLLTTSQVAKILNCHMNTVRNYVRQGLLTNVGISDRKFRFSKNELMNELDKLKAVRHKRISPY